MAIRVPDGAKNSTQFDNLTTQISLVRGDEAEMYGDSNVGELLKRKASEGVSNERLQQGQRKMF